MVKDNGAGGGSVVCRRGSVAMVKDIGCFEAECPRYLPLVSKRRALISVRPLKVM